MALHFRAHIFPQLYFVNSITDASKTVLYRCIVMLFTLPSDAKRNTNEAFCFVSGVTRISSSLLVLTYLVVDEWTTLVPVPVTELQTFSDIAK